MRIIWIRDVYDVNSRVLPGSIADPPLIPSRPYSRVRAATRPTTKCIAPTMPPAYRKVAVLSQLNRRAQAHRVLEIFHRAE